MTINLEIKKNPEYEKLVPALLPAEKEALRKSIKENGFYRPIIVNENREILDGHSRFDIGKEEGIEPPYDIRKSDNKLEEKKFVSEVNLQRRQLNAAQKAELGFELYGFRYYRISCFESRQKICRNRDKPRNF